jgi:hypothetical protein
MRGGWNVHHGPARSFNYALAETTAVTKATVMIKINIVTALIAFVVIFLLLPLTEATVKVADRSVHRGRSGRGDRPLCRFFSILKPGFGFGANPGIAR